MKMSRQTYVDDHLMCEVEGNYLSCAAVVGHDGAVWAQSSDFPQLTIEEINGIMKEINEPGSRLFLGGIKFMVIQGEPGDVIRGKKGYWWCYCEEDELRSSVSIRSTSLRDSVNMIVEGLGAYLIEQDF